MNKNLKIWIFAGIIGVVNLANASAPDVLWTKTYGGQ
jgi:hypothetical protein